MPEPGTAEARSPAAPKAAASACAHTTRAVAAGFDLNWRRHEADRFSMPNAAGDLFSVGYSFADPTVIG